MIIELLDASVELHWGRLAITRSDMDSEAVFPVPVKETDRRTPGYIEKYSLSYGAEVES
jgi:hypothetical protein